MNLLFAILLIFLIGSESRVIQVIEIFRHGARYPTFFFQGDYSEDIKKIHSAGQLTSQGKNMQYLLGQYLRKKYWKELFGNTQYEFRYNQSKFFVRSSNFNRSIESAQCQIIGWLQNLQPLTLDPQSYNQSLPPLKELQKNMPISSWKIFGQKGSSFHSIPIHVYRYGANILDQGQMLAATDYANCPNQQIWEQQNYNSKLAKLVENNIQVKNAILALQKQINLRINIWEVYKYVDNYYSLKSLGYKYLKIFQDIQHQQAFKFLYLISFIFRNLYTQNQQKTAVSGLLKQILYRMKKIINNSDSEQLLLYSGHDSSITPILTAFEYLDPQCIYNKFINRHLKLKQQNKNNQKCFTEMTPYASNIIFELIEQQKQYFIKVFYNDQQLQLPFCRTQTCNLKFFQNWIKQYVIGNILTVCGVRDEQIVLKIIIGILCFLSVVLIVVVLILRNKLIKKYIQHQNSEQRGIQLS